MVRLKLRDAAARGFLCAAVLRATCAWGQTPAPIEYVLKAPAPETHMAEITVKVPTGGASATDLMMPVWTPGFYRVENYAGKVRELTVTDAAGKALAVDQPQPNRWHVQTAGADSIILSYKLLCDGRSVTTNWVGSDYAVINGGASFITLAEKNRRPHVIQIVRPDKWKGTITSLDAAGDGQPDKYIAPDFDTLVDSPILAGNFSVHEFTVNGSRHFLVDAGDVGEWDGKAAAANLEKIARANDLLWRGLPFKKYVFLDVFRPGGGGLEHLNSTLLTSQSRSAPPGGTIRWLSFVSHEYFHAFNVKRLRPIDLGPFDYEKAPAEPSLWVSEGLTVYYGELMVNRAGLATPADFLNSMSSHIRTLQNGAGHLKQTLEQASLAVWTQSTSGIGGDAANTVSYYEKGAVVGFLLDAKIRHLTSDKKSLDVLMRLAMKRYGGQRGFKPEEFEATASEVAGSDLKDWFQKVLRSTEELDYSEALDWFWPAPGHERRPEKKLDARSTPGCDRRPESARPRRTDGHRDQSIKPSRDTAGCHKRSGPPQWRATSHVGKEGTKKKRAAANFRSDTHILKTRSLHPLFPSPMPSSTSPPNPARQRRGIDSHHARAPWAPERPLKNLMAPRHPHH